jgi:hypothetical protein
MKEEQNHPPSRLAWCCNERYNAAMIRPFVRAPWPPDFPEVIVHADVPRRDAHSCYAAAKAGDADAALVLALNLLSGTAVDTLRGQVRGRSCLLLPVIAE